MEILLTIIIVIDFTMPERKAWSSEEDEVLKSLRQEQQITKWSVIAKKMADQYNMPGRTGKQCRERYHNHLDSAILRTEWSAEQEKYLYELHDEIGNKWAIIAQKLPGRTDNCVKNHFYSKMRKAIRKLNKIIYQYFKKDMKEIKLSVLYKIVEATDEKFKFNGAQESAFSDKCSKIKSNLLEYSNDQENSFDGNLDKLQELARSIHQFSSKYRKKPRKVRRNSIQNSDMRVTKLDFKGRSNVSDVESEDSEYSMVFSHDYEDDSDEGMEQKNSGNKLQDIKEDDNDLKESVNSNLNLNSNYGQQQGFTNVLKPPQMGINIPGFESKITNNTFGFGGGLIKPPVVINQTPKVMIKPPVMNNNIKNSISMQNDANKIQRILQHQGLLQMSEQFSNPIGGGGLARSGSLKDSDFNEEDYKGNMLSESIQRMRIGDYSFDLEIDEENKLFISN